MANTRNGRFSLMSLGRPYVVPLPQAGGGYAEADLIMRVFRYGVDLSFELVPVRNLVGVQLAAPNIVGREPV